MVEDDPCAKAYQAIGAYFCAFSALERELGEAIKVIFRLEQHEASDAIVAAFGDVSKKINLVWSRHNSASVNPQRQAAAR